MTEIATCSAEGEQGQLWTEGPSDSIFYDRGTVQVGSTTDSQDLEVFGDVESDKLRLINAPAVGGPNCNEPGTIKYGNNLFLYCQDGTQPWKRLVQEPRIGSGNAGNSTSQSWRNVAVVANADWK